MAAITPEREQQTLEIARICAHKALQRGKPRFCEAEDVLSAAYIAAWQALRSHREDGGASIASFTWTSALRAAQGAICNAQHVTRSCSEHLRDRLRAAPEEEAPEWLCPPVSLDALFEQAEGPDSGWRIPEMQPLWQQPAEDPAMVALDVLEGEDLAARLEAHLATLEPRDGELCRLRYWEGLTVTELAHRLGYSRQWIYIRLERIHQRLREQMEEAVDDRAA